ncbi:hypothetical protein QVE09_22330 [Paenibacillus sp. ClWae2A]|uniref:hypothetical protein n=1 Tax=Paenibacillus sp. ClWae2A TaxID=3057177 RepID=UPI0028F678CA|nr:hypothetical protein [Paenibacillus sp. ClWae2A]MDT9721644.1 hypothetical protein [Paenibacillus sp. ClWae2A]
MKKRIASVLLSLILTVSFSSVSFAAENTSLTDEQNNAQVELTKQKIIEIMGKLNEHRANKLLNEAEGQQTENVLNSFNLIGSQDPIELKLERELRDLGVSTLTNEEVNQRFSDPNSVSPQVSVPPTTSAIKWYEINYSITRSGTTYSLQDLYAQGLNGNSNLAVGANGSTLYTNKQILVKNISNIASMYAQKAVGAIPIVQWLPYELLFSSNDNVTNNSYVVTHRSLSTVCFTYVKKSGQSDSYQSLGWISNMFTVASSHTLAGYNNGTPYSKTTDKTNTTYADSYASGSKAVDFLTGVSSQTRSFVSSYTFYNHDKSAKLTYYVVNPSFPAHIQ